MIAPLVMPVVIERSTAKLSEQLPGMPITKSTAALVENAIACIEREQQIRRDQSFEAEELALLRAYHDQIDRVFEHGRNKAQWEWTHPCLKYPWSVPL